MSALTTPSRITKTAMQHMHRHGWHTAAAVSVMTLTFFITSMFILVALGANQILNFFEQQPQMIIFFKDDATSQQVNEIKHVLEETGKVKTTHYTSKDEALAFYKDQMKDNPALLENLSSNILPASLEISPKNVTDLGNLASIAKDNKYANYVESVSLQQDVVNRLATWTSTGRTIGLALVGFLALISFLIILVTIGLNIASFRDEIEIMRLVGANSWYIRGPFIMEGMLYGLIASVVSVGVVYLSLPFVAPKIQKYLEGIQIFPIDLRVLIYLLLVEFAFGIILGVAGSMAAMRRSMKV